MYTILLICSIYTLIRVDASWKGHEKCIKNIIKFFIMSGVVKYPIIETVL